MLSVPQDVQIISGEYIVILKDSFEGRVGPTIADKINQKIDSVLTQTNISSDSVLSRWRYAIRGFAVKSNKEKVDKLVKHDLIDHVGPNYLIPIGEIENGPIISTTTVPQSIPWGISRVGGPFDGTGEKAWIIDTGIDLDNSDLNVDIVNSVSFVAGESPDDGLGHGTHVAGILAAKDNDIDAVGVATDATVVSVKACNNLPPSHPDSGCPKQSIIDALEYVALHATSSEVINMSIWGSGDGDIDQAVYNVADNGLRLTLIAGNAASDANNYSPGRVNHSNLWTLSATDINDDFAVSFSNFENPPVDYSDPGASITSLQPGGGLAIKSGTSMAAPHMAGLLLAAPYGIATGGYASNDPDGNADRIGVADTMRVTILGPGILTEGEEGTWEASVSNYVAPLNYQWYYRQSFSDPWTAAGSNSSIFSHTFNTPSNDAGVRAIVTDNNGQNEDRSRKIIVNEDPCPPWQICGN